MPLHVQVVSQRPPGGRCTLYAGYADVLGRHLGASTELVISTMRDAHADGFPSLWLNGAVVQPSDGVILMPADVLFALVSQGMPDEAMFGLIEALEVPLDRLLEEEG